MTKKHRLIRFMTRAYGGDRDCAIGFVHDVLWIGAAARYLQPFRPRIPQNWVGKKKSLLGGNKKLRRYVFI